MPKHVTVYYYADQLKERKKNSEKKNTMYLSVYGSFEHGIDCVSVKGTF